MWCIESDPDEPWVCALGVDKGGGFVYLVSGGVCGDVVCGDAVTGFTPVGV